VKSKCHERAIRVGRAAVALLMYASVAGCNESPSSRNVSSRAAAPSAARDPKSGLPVRVEPVKISCSGKGYTATYSAQTRSMPATVDVTFRGAAPTSDTAERGLRRCLQVVADTQFVTTEVMGTVFYSRSGRESDDEPVALKDGSDHLVYQPENKRIITWNQREGDTATVESNSAGGYFVRSETHKVLVPPGGTFDSLSVVFEKEPTEKTAFEVVIAEVKKAIAKRTLPVATSGFAEVGTAANPAGWRQIRGADGRYISVEYDPKRGDQLVSGSGRSLGASGQLR
jgi:hypothetical protein